MKQNRDKIVYVAGKYTADTPEGIDTNIKLSENYSITIWNLGLTAFTPHLNSARFERKGCNTDWQGFMDGYLEVLNRCDILFLLPNWKESKGACIEEKFAKDKNIPIVYSLEELITYMKDQKWL
jgi:hypothetical protein